MTASEKLPTRFVVRLLACMSFALVVVQSVRHRAQPSQSEPGQVRPVDPGSKQAPLDSYGKLPLSFEANQGQADSHVKFLSRGSGYGLYLTAAEAILTLRNPKTDTRASLDLAASQSLGQDSSTVVFRFLRVNRAVRMEGRDQLPSKSNYLIGNDPSKWRTNLPTYGKVKYRNSFTMATRGNWSPISSFVQARNRMPSPSPSKGQTACSSMGVETW